MEYKYKAVTKDGHESFGAREATSAADLARELREQGLYLVWARDSSSATPPDDSSGKTDFWTEASRSFDFLFKHVGLAEKVVFARHLGLMIKSGFSLNKALDTLARQTPNKYFASALKDIASKVTGGKSFHESVAEHKNIFPMVFISMVKIGEASGKLEETLRLATRHLKREHILKRKIKGALVYPAIIVALMAGVGAVMMVFVLPQLAQTFSELNVPLPLSTRAFFALANFLERFWYFAAIIFLALVWSCYFFVKKTELGRKVLNFIFLKLPIFSDLTKKLNSARFARTLNSLLSGGVSMTEALKITSETLDNFFYRKAVAETIPEVEKGKTLSSVLVKYPSLFPPVVTEMTAVGEETGSLTVILKELARFFEGEVSVATKSLSSIVEPIIMILVGLAVGVFALSIIQPIYSIGTGL
ncbi:MAG: type II secretion system F family protein [Parcubacteria group bacterium]|nr:type II secretion system F family protein [Parcubacteria group bacterium]